MDISWAWAARTVGLPVCTVGELQSARACVWGCRWAVASPHADGAASIITMTRHWINHHIDLDRMGMSADTYTHTHAVHQGGGCSDGVKALSMAELSAATNPRVSVQPYLHATSIEH